jgi:methionine-gamma-lyase
MNNKEWGFETRSIHAGGEHRNAHNALNPPIYQTSTFVFDSVQHVEDVMSFKSSDYVYTRGNNPTLRLFENRMADLENGIGAVAFASGMAAISSVLFSLVKPGEKVLTHKTLYGSSHSVITQLLPRYGMEYIITDLSGSPDLDALCDEKVRVIYFETPSNPSLVLIDIQKITEYAKSRNIKVVVDNTFASPYFQRPLELGADVVCHSATKYICGHGDVVAGVAVARDSAYLQSLKFDYMCEFGGVLSPFNAWLLLRGLKTLAVRMRQHEANAQALAEFLLAHPMVDSVFYPGLPGFPDHDLAKRQMSGFGGVLSFEVKGGLDKAKRFVDEVKLIQLAVSLGDCETLIELPAAMTHRGYDAARLAEFGLTESMVRISVGLESSEDLIADLEQAFNRI